MSISHCGLVTPSIPANTYLKKAIGNLLVVSKITEKDFNNLFFQC